MQKVDARGQQCPIPVVQTKRAIQALGGSGEVEVLVDNEIAVQNLTKMAEQGTEVIFAGATILEVALMAKQRKEMGYKWPIVHTSDNLVDILFSICGKDGAQGIIGNRNAPWELKKVTRSV